MVLVSDFEKTGGWEGNHWSSANLEDYWSYLKKMWEEKLEIILIRGGGGRSFIRKITPKRIFISSRNWKS